MESLIDAAHLTALQDTLVEQWHAQPVGFSEDRPLLSAILENHARNFELWHEEDKARDPVADDAAIAAVKRAIDGLNQARNNAMEKVDELVLGEVAQESLQDDLPLHTETVGSIVDRLSILSLKIFHMREQTERSDVEQAHLESSRGKLAVLIEQRTDLAWGLAVLLDEIQNGRKRFKVYRQMKMYNDPAFNPVLYRKGR